MQVYHLDMGVFSIKGAKVSEPFGYSEYNGYNETSSTKESEPLVNKLIG